MRFRTATVLVALLIAQANGGEEGGLIPGTNVVMDSHDLFQWNRSWNTHRLSSGSGTMRAYYLRLPLDEAIERLRLRILRPPLLTFPKCEIDKEWSEGSDKHFLTCHGKFTYRDGDGEIRTYALFIARGGETYAFVTRLNLFEYSDQETEGKVLAAYQSSRISDQPVDIRSALPYEARLPANYVLQMMTGMESDYQINRGANRDPDFLSIGWWDDREDSRLRGYLPGFDRTGHVKIFEGTLHGSSREREAWKLVWLDTAGRKYRIQYITRKGRHVLGLDALIGEKSYRANPTEIERLAAGVKARKESAK